MAHGDGTIKLVSKPEEPERYEISVSLGRDLETGKYRRVKRIVECDYEHAVIIRDRLKHPEQAQESTSTEALCETTSGCEPPHEADASPSDQGHGRNIALIAAPLETTIARQQPDYIPPSRTSSLAPASEDSFAALVSFHVNAKKVFGCWAASTEHEYRYCMDKYVIPYLGPVPIDLFSTRLIEEYYYQFMLEYRDKTGRSGAGILAEVHRHLKATFATAVRREIVSKNPCTNAERPKYEKPEKGTLDVEGTRRLVGLLDDEGDNGFTIGARLGLCAGFRPEESLGLAWRTVDFNTGAARIIQAKTRIELKGPKSKSSKRTVVFDERTAAHIKEYRKEQAASLGALGIEQGLDTFLMTGKNGKPLGYEAYKTWWRRFRERNQVYSSTGKYLTLHELRHTYCSLLISQGAPVTAVSKAVGHRDANITCAVYAHALPGHQEELAQTFGSILG